MTPVDQKRAFNKLKHDFEPWRNVLVQIHSVLTWEKKFYPAVIFVAITVFFLTLWLLDLSMLTMLSLTGLFGITFDPLYQAVSRFLYRTDEWNGIQEAKFEMAISQICAVKIKFAACYDFIFTEREQKSSLSIIITSVSLLALAWLGAVFNNLLLIYLITLGIVFYPGVREQKVFNCIKQKLGFAVISKNQQYREKAKKTDNNDVGKAE